MTSDDMPRGPSVGLVGCGRWGRLILRDLVSLGVEVHVTVRTGHDVDAARARGAASVVFDADDLPPVDGIVVATPTAVHAETLQAVLGRRVPVYVEKPMTDDPASARRFAEQAGDRLFVMDKWRYHPGVHALRELVTAGRLGTVRHLETVRVQDGSPHLDVDCAWILLPHDLSIALEVLGTYPQPATASARLDDGGALAGLEADLEFDTGAATPGVTMHMTVGVDHPTAVRRITVVGDRATAVLAGGWEEQVTVAGADGSDTVVEAIGELPLLAELRAFVAHLQGGPPPLSSAAEGARAVELVARLRALAGIGP